MVECIFGRIPAEGRRIVWKPPDLRQESWSALSVGEEEIRANVKFGAPALIHVRALRTNGKHARSILHQNSSQPHEVVIRIQQCQVNVTIRLVFRNGVRPRLIGSLLRSYPFSKRGLE